MTMSPDPLPPDDANVVDPAVLSERRAQRAELAEQVAARRAADAQALAAELAAERARLEAELEQARLEPERLSRLVAERERALRAAELRAHAEEAQRIEARDALAEAQARFARELAEARGELQRSREQAQRTREEVEAAARRELEEARTRVERAEAEREEARTRAERTAAELVELRGRAERAEATAAERGDERERVTAAADEQRSELEARLARTELTVSEQRARIEADEERHKQASKRAASELAALRERVAEAEQIAAAAESARRRAEAKRGASREKRRRALEEVERLSHELAAARAEASAAREGADAVLAEVAHEQAEREQLRAQLAQARAERDALRDRLERDGAGGPAAAPAPGDGSGKAPAASSPVALPLLHAELALARSLRAGSPAAPTAAATDEATPVVDAAAAPAPAAGLAEQPAASAATRLTALERERRMVERRAATAARRRGHGGRPLPSEVDARGAGEPEAGAAVGAGDRADVGAIPFAAERGSSRAMPVTALALERERSSRLQSQLDRQAATERELREQIAQLERAIASRMDAEQRIEGALRRVRGELEAANALRMLTERGSPTRSLISHPEPLAPQAGEAVPAPAADAPQAAPAADAPAAPSGDAAQARPAADAPGPPVAGEEPPPAALPGFDAARLAEARERLRASAEPLDAPADDDAPAADAPAADGPDSGAPEAAAPAPADRATADAPAGSAFAADAAPALGQGLVARETPPTSTAAAVPARRELLAPQAAPSGPATPWLPRALRRLAAEDPETAGRILVGMLPAQGLVSQRVSYDLVLSDRGTVAVDVHDGRTTVRPLEGPRRSSDVDVRISTDHAGLARLLLRRRGLRRRARVKGSRRKLRELRRLAREPLALRDLAATGANLEPALALWLAALAIDSSATFGNRFTIAHAPLPGGPPDAWMRIQHGAPIAVLRTRPGEEPSVTLRCTRGALLALLAGVAPPPGEGAAIDGDLDALERVRGWIRATEFGRA